MEEKLPGNRTGTHPHALIYGYHEGEKKNLHKGKKIKLHEMIISGLAQVHKVSELQRIVSIRETCNDFWKNIPYHILLWSFYWTCIEVCESGLKVLQTDQTTTKTLNRNQAWKLQGKNQKETLPRNMCSIISLVFIGNVRNYHSHLVIFAENVM